MDKLVRMIETFQDFNKDTIRVIQCRLISLSHIDIHFYHPIEVRRMSISKTLVMKIVESIITLFSTFSLCSKLTMWCILFLRVISNPFSICYIYNITIYYLLVKYFFHFLQKKCHTILCDSDSALGTK